MTGLQHHLHNSVKSLHHFNVFFNSQSWQEAGGIKRIKDILV